MTALPHDPDAERTILGACIVENEALPAGLAQLDRADFYQEKHRLIWDGMRELTERSERVDLVTLRYQLQKSGTIADAGGVAYLAALVDGVPRISNLDEWCAIVRRHAQQRGLIQSAHRLVKDAMEGADPADLIADMDAALHNLGARGGGAGPLDNAELAKEAIRWIDQRSQAKGGIVGDITGLEQLDALMGGIRPGRMGVIASRLANGKTMLALQVAGAIADQNPEKAVLFASLEMDGVELMERRLSADAGVAVGSLWLAQKAKGEAAWERLAQSFASLSKSNLRIVEDAWTVPEIAQHARALRSETGLAAVVVDYFQLLEGTGKRYETRNVELQGISHALRKLAKQMRVPFIVVAQLNREAADRSRGKEKRKVPEIHEIEGTDALGKDAHWVVLIDRLTGEHDGLADLYLRKNRGGRTGKCTVVFDGERARYQNLEWAAAPAEGRATA